MEFHTFKIQRFRAFTSWTCGRWPASPCWFGLFLIFLHDREVSSSYDYCPVASRWWLHSDFLIKTWLFVAKFFRMQKLLFADCGLLFLRREGQFFHTVSWISWAFISCYLKRKISSCCSVFVSSKRQHYSPLPANYRDQILENRLVIWSLQVLRWDMGKR